MRALLYWPICRCLLALLVMVYLLAFRAVCRLAAADAERTAVCGWDRMTDRHSGRTHGAWHAGIRRDTRFFSHYIAYSIYVLYYTAQQGSPQRRQVVRDNNPHSRTHSRDAV